MTTGNSQGWKCLCIAVAVMATTWSYGKSQGKDLDNRLGRHVPQQMKLMVASFGTIDSQAEVEGWLTDQLKPLKSTGDQLSVSQSEQISNPSLAAEVAYVNWSTRKLEYFQRRDALQAENVRRAKILTNLKTRMLSDSAQRYTQLGRDYLQARLYKKVGKLIAVVDRGNMTIQQTEKSLKGEDCGIVAGADCILSVVLGDRESKSSTITIDNVGTTVKRTTFSQPYVGKIRDLYGNILCAFDGVAEWKTTRDNVVSTEESDPARILVEKVCDNIADEMVAYFTTELIFKIRVPAGLDPEDAEVFVDGREVEDGKMRVLSFEHVVKGVLDGCADIVKTVEPSSEKAEKTVKLNFKKNK